jgi:hypothetical protein
LKFLHTAGRFYWAWQAFTTVVNSAIFLSIIILGHYEIHIFHTILEQKVKSHTPNKHHAINITVGRPPCFHNLSTVDGGELSSPCSSSSP